MEEEKKEAEEKPRKSPALISQERQKAWCEWRVSHIKNKLKNYLRNDGGWRKVKKE